MTGAGTEDSDISTWLQVSSTIPSAINCPDTSRYKSVMGAPNSACSPQNRSGQNPSNVGASAGNQSILAKRIKSQASHEAATMGTPRQTHKRDCGYLERSDCTPPVVSDQTTRSRLADDWPRWHAKSTHKKRDNLIDAAGYVKCVDMIDQRGGVAGRRILQPQKPGRAPTIEDKDG